MSPEEITFKAQEIIARSQPPDNGMSDRDTVNALIEVLDGPDAVAMAIAHGRIPSEPAAKIIHLTASRTEH